MRDDMIYHLLVPKQIAESGYLSFDPYNINANFPMLFEMPLVAVEQWGKWVSPFIVNFAMLVLLGICYYSIATKLFRVKQEIALLSLPLVVYTPVFYDLLHSTYVEIFFALLILLVFYNYLQFIDDRKKTNYWYLSMLFLGLACSTKYLGIPFALFIVVYEFFTKSDKKRYYLGIGLCLLPALPWYLKSWILLGNPVFPLFNWFFESPHLSIMRLVQFKHMYGDYHMGKDLIDYALLPLRLLGGIDAVPKPGEMGFNGKLSAFFVLSLLGMGFKDRKKRLLSLLLIFYSVFWAIQSQQVRFFLPVLLLSSLIGLERLGRYWERHKMWICVFASAILIQNIYNISSGMKEQKISNLLTGQMGKESFLSFHMPYSYGMVRQINTILNRETDKVLTFGNFGRNYYFNIPVITNTYYDVEIVDRAFKNGEVNTEILENFLDNENITHLLFNPRYYSSFHRNDPSVDFNALEKYFNRNMTVVLKKDNYVLLEYKQRREFEIPAK